MAVKLNYSHADLEALWLLAGGSPASADTAAAIAEAESKGCLYAKAGPTDDRPLKACTYRKTSKENSYSLWQVNRMAHPQYTAKELYTALGVAKAAVAISNGGANFKPWTTYVSGEYKQYLHAPVTSTTGTSTNTSTDANAPFQAGNLGWHALNHATATTLPTALTRTRMLRREILRRLS